MRAPRTATSAIAHLMPGFAAMSRTAARSRAAAKPATTAVPVTHLPMSEAERRAYHAAARAERERWSAVMSTSFPVHLAPAAIQMLGYTGSSAQMISQTLASLAETTPPPSAMAQPPRSGAQSLAARVAEHRARAEQPATAEALATAEAADAADFARFASQTMAKVRHPDAPPLAMPHKSHR